MTTDSFSSFIIDRFYRSFSSSIQPMLIVSKWKKMFVKIYIAKCQFYKSIELHLSWKGYLRNWSMSANAALKLKINKELKGFALTSEAVTKRFS